MPRWTCLNSYVIILTLMLISFGKMHWEPWISQILSETCILILFFPQILSLPFRLISVLLLSCICTIWICSIRLWNTLSPCRKVAISFSPLALRRTLRLCESVAKICPITLMCVLFRIADVTSAHYWLEQAKTAFNTITYASHMTKKLPNFLHTA